MNRKEKIQKLKSLLSYKKSLAFYARKMGTTVEEVKDILKEIRKEKEIQLLQTEIPQNTETHLTYTVSVNEEKGTLESVREIDFEPKSVEELAQLHKIDLTKYKISNYWSKLKGNGKFTSSVFASLKKPKDYTAEDFANFLSSYKTTRDAKLEAEPNTSQNQFVDVELSIYDFHLGKKTIEKESIQDKCQQFKKTVTDLTSKVRSCYNIDTLVFPISNDFFHTDNYQNQTTNGTPQDVLVGYDHEYEVGFDLLVECIEYLLSQAQEVEVVLVQGNHDRTKSFYLAHALEVYFSNSKRVFFQREHSTTKWVVLGETFIGYHHGNCKIDELPLLFATGKSAFDFGNSTYREIHTGDRHHYMAKEIKGVRIQQMPSLSGTDRWHLDNNYVHNIRCGIATCYDLVQGRVAEFESRI